MYKTFVFQVFTEDASQHPDYEDVLILITHKYIVDGQLAFSQAEKLKKKGVNIISVATGHKRIAQQVKNGLQVLSSDPSNVHSADYLALWNIVDDILVNICGLGSCPSCKYLFTSLYALLFRVYQKKATT